MYYEENSAGDHGGRDRKPFWKGIKQLAPVGPAGEIIMDYSIHDAWKQGSTKSSLLSAKILKKNSAV